MTGTIARHLGSIFAAGAITSFFKKVWDKLSDAYEAVFARKSLAIKFGVATLASTVYYGFGWLAGPLLFTEALIACALSTFILGSVMVFIHLVYAIVKEDVTALYTTVRDRVSTLYNSWKLNREMKKGDTQRAEAKSTVKPARRKRKAA